MKVVDNNGKIKVDFANLEPGDCFKDEDGDTLMKTDQDQEAVDLSDGSVYHEMCGDMVTPCPNAELHVN